MAEKSKRPSQTRREHSVQVQADTLGSTLLPSDTRARLVHPDATPLHQIPKENDVETTLSKIENLLGKGHYGAALNEGAALTIADSPLAAEYELIRHEKVSRAQLGIGDQYFIRGDLDKAGTFYQSALQVDAANPTVKTLTETAVLVFDNLLDRRTRLIEGLRESIQTANFDQWCGQKKDLGNFTILDVNEIRANVVADFQLERIFGEHPPIVPQAGFFTPLLPEGDSVDSSSALPGSVFRSVIEGSINVDIGGSATPAGGNAVRASLAMPLIGNVMKAKLGLFAVNAGLDVAGQASGTVPLFRYEYLRDKTRQTIGNIQQVESRMLPIQFELDDFAEIVDAIRRPLAEQEAELEAVKKRINELVTQLAALAQSKKAVDAAIIAFDPIVDECECDWWCWLLDVLTIAVDVAFLAAVFALALDPATSALVPALLIVLVEPPLIIGNIVVFDCENVSIVQSRFKDAQRGLQQSINENQAELTHALATRDILIARINALEDELSEVYQSNAARVLDAKTLGLIEVQYNNLRQSLLTRAQAVARLAEDAFNFERDTDVHLVRDSYFDKDRKDYSAAETLLRDLDGLDYIDTTGRTEKAMQLSQTVSLRKHYPVSFATLRLTGGTRFTTELKEFDYWFPGTHQQRIKEITVEVLLQGKPVPVRGYLSNDGVSMVRFQDTRDTRPIDNVHVFPEPDEDLAKLGYKRLQRRRHVDTMAFPDFTSYLHEERMRKLQDRERNFFENVGLESTWIIELLPDQAVDLSKLTDVLIHFQYEALFDDNLKRVLEKKRYVGRKEVSTISIKQTVAEVGKTVDFSEEVSFRAPVHRLEAPAIARKIVDVGFIIKPEQQPHLDGPAKIDVAYDGVAPVQVVTNEKGIVATAADFPTGSGLAELEAMARGKSLDKVWSIKIAALPGGLSADVIDDILLLLKYEYS